MTRGFKITELWCLDGAEYHTRAGFEIVSTLDGYEVTYPTPAEAVPLLPTEQTSFHQVDITMVIPAVDVAGVVMGQVEV